MLITKTSLLSGAEHTRDIDITEYQLAAHAAGSLIQNVAPHLSAEDREFLISGITPDEWIQFNICEDCEI